MRQWGRRGSRAGVKATTTLALGGAPLSALFARLRASLGAVVETAAVAVVAEPGPILPVPRTSRKDFLAVPHDDEYVSVSRKQSVLTLGSVVGSLVGIPTSVIYIYFFSEARYVATRW